MNYTRLSYVLILWVIILVALSMSNISAYHKNTLMVLILGLGALLLGYMASLRRLLQLLVAAYIIVVVVVLYVIIKPTSLHEPTVILLYTPILLYAIYAWLKRPKYT